MACGQIVPNYTFVIRQTHTRTIRVSENNGESVTDIPTQKETEELQTETETEGDKHRHPHTLRETERQETHTKSQKDTHRQIDTQKLTHRHRHLQIKTVRKQEIYYHPHL